MKLRTKAFIYLLLVSIIWGAASPVVKYTLQWFDPWLFLTYRFFISTLIALPFLKFPKKPSDQWLVLLTGFISAPLSLFLFFTALDKTTALSGSLITAAGPLFLILGGVLFFRDRVTKREKFGIAIALIGTLLTVFSPGDVGKLEGNALMILAVVTDIFGALLTKEAMKKGISPTLVAQIAFVIGFAVFLPIMLLTRDTMDVVTTIAFAPWQAHAGVLFMAVLSGTFAYTIRNIAIKSIEVSESALYSYLQPLWAAMLAVLWLREPITPSYIIGGIVIAVGVVIAEAKRTQPR